VSRRLVIAIAVVAFVLVGACLASATLGRRAFFRYAARAALAGQGVTCGDDFDVTPDASYAHATIAPCTCTVASGPIQQIELVDAVTVDLDGDRVSHVHAGHVRIAIRADAAQVDAGALGPVAVTLGVPARIAAIVAAASHVATLHPPALELAALEATISDRPAVTIDALALDGRSPLGLSARAVTLPALTGPLGTTATVAIDALSGTATASEVHLEGDFTLDGNAPILGAVARHGHVRVTGTELDGSAPSYRIEL
jgi:hypothetical protein